MRHLAIWKKLTVLRHVVFLTVSVTLPVAAQTPFSSGITGTVRDATPAVLAGAVVSISAPTLIGGAQATTTDDRGEYRFTLLPPGVYDIVVSAAGFRPARRAGVRVASGETVTIDVGLEVSAITDEVVIRGDSPVVDVKSAAVPIRLDEALLQNLPANRSIAATINLAPGIVSNVAFGGSQESNEILLDGVRTTGPMEQEPVLRANYNWMQEMNIVALGAPAEYGGFTGAAAFAVLRSGANRFSGLGELWTTQPGWLANNTKGLEQALSQSFASRDIENWYDSSAQVGGPIVHDRLWFFAGVQRFRHDDRPAGYGGPGSRDQRDLQTLVRPTAALSSQLRLDGFIEFGRYSVDGENLGPQVALEATSVVRAPQTTWNGHLMWVAGERTIVEARSGGYTANSDYDPRPPATLDGPPPVYDYGTDFHSQNAPDFGHTASQVMTTAGSIAQVIERRWGLRHDLKVGGEFEHTYTRGEYGYPAGVLLLEEFGEPMLMEVWAGQSRQASTNRWVLHAQDGWTVTERLTLSLGARAEFNRGSVPLISNVFHTNTLAPRLGAAWDIGAAHRTVVRAHYGQFYDPIFSFKITAEDWSNQNPSVTYAADSDQWVEVSRSRLVDTFSIDPRLRHSHVNQWVSGIEHALASDLALQVQYIRRRFDTYMGQTDPTSTWAPIQRQDPGPDGRLGTADDGPMLDVFNLTSTGPMSNFYTNPPGAYNKYDALQVVARKRYARDWQAQASYTLSRTRGTVGNTLHVNAGGIGLGRPGNFIDPNQNINAYGRAQFDPTHEVKLLSTFRVAPWGGTMLSGVYRYTTGQAWSRMVLLTGLNQGPQRVRVEPVGTRRVPAINQFDVRIEKTARLGATKVGLFADVFNLFNQGVPDSNQLNPVAQFSGARFGLPNVWLDPRLLRVGARVTF